MITVINKIPHPIKNPTLAKREFRSIHINNHTHELAFKIEELLRSTDIQNESTTVTIYESNGQVKYTIKDASSQRIAENIRDIIKDKFP